MSDFHGATSESDIKPEAAGPEPLALQKTCQMSATPFEGLSDQELAELFNLPQYSAPSKQERDYAVAAILLRGKHLNERNFRRVLKNWTPFGDLPLLEFLRLKKVLSDEAFAQVEQRVNEYLQSLDGTVTPKEWVSPARRTSRVLERIDPSGRVAKLFGVSQIPKAVTGSEFRSFQSRFRLLRKLGQGGLGTVWLAVDTSLHRYVAVKEIVGHCDGNPSAMARFRREAEITGRLEHPSIVPIHLFGQNEVDGRSFYVMRFLGNVTLEDAIRDYHERRETGQDQPMAFRRLLTAFVSVCEAIAYAHSRGVVHRDLKPQNIALDSFGQVIVLDWGLAKMMGMEDPQAHLVDDTQPGGVDLLDITLAGQVTGTPMYMAPEQASGRVDEIDERTDVYGLGSILYAILTGYAPHELSSESLAAGSRMSALLDAIVDQPFRAPREINPQVSPPLEAICIKAMERDRHLRYPTAASLCEDLQRWMANEPVLAFPDANGMRIYRWIQKHRQLSQVIAAGLTIVLATCLIGGVLAYQGHVAEQNLDLQLAVSETQDLRGRLTYAVESQRENTRFMSRVPPIQGIIDSRMHRAGNDEAVWAEHLRKTYQGLMDVNRTYTAISLWTFDEQANAPLVRVESAESQRGRARTDLQEFAKRHLPGIKALERGDIYVAMPGYLSSATNVNGGASAAIARKAGHNLVSGIGTYDEKTRALTGCVTIECDLENVIREHFRRHERVRKTEIWLTDHTGRCAMLYTRERGLYPAEAGADRDFLPASLAPFFNPQSTADIVVPSANLAIARIPLKRDAPECFMGVVVQFEK